MTELLARLPAALLLNLALAAVAYAGRAVEWTGALAGLGYGLVVYLCLGWQGYALLTLFVVLGSGFTRLGYRRKHAAGTAQERGGRRTWRNATANCAVGAACALVAWATGSEAAVWAAVAAFAAALADTTESELGVLAARTAYLPGSWQPVPPGTEGAVSPAGTLLGLAVAVALAATAAGLALLPWRAVAPVALAALLGTLLESWLGARRPLSNELLNTVTTASAALLAAGAALL